MSEEIVRCPRTNFKCVKSQLYKTYGYCPVAYVKYGELIRLSKQVWEDMGSKTDAEIKTLLEARKVRGEL